MGEPHICMPGRERTGSMTKPGDQRPAAVTQAPDGTWQVTAPDGSMLATCATNAEAWKAYDKLAGSPASEGVNSPPATAAAISPSAAAPSAAHFKGGNGNLMCRSFRAGTIRSMHIRIAVMSPQGPSRSPYELAGRPVRRTSPPMQARPCCGCLAGESNAEVLIPAALTFDSAGICKLALA
jgi:hypothetical protein